MLNQVLREFEGLAVVHAEVTGRLSLTQDCEDDLIRALAFVVESDKLDNALQILDDKRLRLFTSTSGRRVHVVSGSHRKQYVCLPDYCTCESFFQAAKKSAAPAMVSLFIFIVLNSNKAIIIVFQAVFTRALLSVYFPFYAVQALAGSSHRAVSLRH